MQMDVKDLDIRLSEINVLLQKLGASTEDKANNIITQRPKAKTKKQLPFNLLDKIADIPESNGSRYFKKSDITIGIICDEFLYNLYKDCAHIIYITPKNYSDYLDSIDILLTVTTWTGLNKAWYGLGNRSKNNQLRKRLYSIMDEFRQNGTKIVFYSKEDPVNYSRFVDVAKNCDYIFTTAIEKINDYVKDCANKKVYLLEFGVNPLYHNPIGSKEYKVEKSVLFSGSWNDVHTKRCVYMDYLLNEVIDSGVDLKIINRNSEVDDERYEFPIEYQPYTYRSIDHQKLQKLHKMFDWAINISTITDSATMTANRVYELQALGNLMISNYSIAINDKHPVVFTSIEEKNDIYDILNTYTDEEVYRLQMHGLRNVMISHTIYHRLKQLLEPLDLSYAEVLPERKLALIVDDMSSNIKQSIECQSYTNFEVFRIQDATEKNLVHYDMIAFFHSDYQYEEFYLEDMVNAFKYTDCDYITKDSYKLNGKLHEGIEHNYVDSMKDKYKSVFWKDSFDVSTLIDLEGELTLKNGYSIDRLELNVGRKLELLSTHKPKFSIILPIFNNGNHLFVKAFMSLRRSKMFDEMEIILVDDGSTDGYTTKIVKRLGRHYANVKTFLYETGGSGSASRPRNKGFEMSTTDYITYLDPDNEAVNDGYTKLYNEMLNNDVDMVIGKMLKITDKALDFKFKRYGIIEHPKQELINDNFSMQSLQALMIRRNIISENLLSQVVGALGQDKLIYFEMLFFCKRILRINQPIHYYYGVVNGSVTNVLGKTFFEKSYLIEVATVNSFYRNGILEAFLKSKFELFFENGYLEKFSRVDIKEANECIDILLSIYELYEEKAGYTFKKEHNRRFIELAKRKDYQTIVFDYIPGQKTRILFAGHELKFLNLIIDRFKQQSKYEVRIDKWMGHNKHDEAYSRECLNWADIIFCEWGLGNAVWYSNNKLAHQKLFIRMHLQERDLPYISQFNINNINKIITITPYLKDEIFSKKCGVPLDKMTMIYNYIDIKRLDLPKTEDARFNIGIMGILPMRKRLDLAIDIIEKVYEIDKRYKLFIKGRMPQDVKWLWGRRDERIYYTEQFERIKRSKAKNNIIFDGFSSDIESWFRKIGFMLSTSDFEGSHQAPMEGASTGSYPVIRKWAGSETVYPKEVIFNTIDEMVGFILNPIVEIQYIKEFTKQLDIKIIYNKYVSLMIQEN